MPAHVPILTCINACRQGALGPGKNPLFNRMTNRLATISRPMPRWYVCRISGHINLVLISIQVLLELARCARYLPLPTVTLAREHQGRDQSWGLSNRSWHHI